MAGLFLWGYTALLYFRACGMRFHLYDPITGWVGPPGQKRSQAMSGLIYNSATDIKVERDYLASLPTPVPMGARHAPYPFHSFVSDTVGAIERAGFTIESEDYAVTKDEQRLFGLLNVCRSEIHEPKWNLLVALRGAHDQSISRGLAIGSQVTICSNLCFHGDLGLWKSKQTTNIAYRIPDMVADAVAGLGNAGERLTVDFDQFNAGQISREEGDDILLQIFRSGGFSSSQLGRAIADWDDCSVEEHTANGRNIWWLFNSCTYALKPTGANSNHGDLQRRSTIVYQSVARGARQLLAA